MKQQTMEEIKKLLNENLKQSSSTNKIRYNILALIDKELKQRDDDIRKEVDTYLTKWLNDFANRPLKDRKDPFKEVVEIRRELLNNLKV